MVFGSVCVFLIAGWDKLNINVAVMGKFRAAWEQ